MCFMVFPASASIIATDLVVNNDKELPFLKITNDTYIFNNKSSRLIIDKHTWQMKLADTEGREHYTDYQKPSFFVQGSWISAEGNSKVELKGGKDILIRISGEKGVNFEIEVNSVSEYGFRIKTRSPGQKISGIRRVVKLNPVEEIYGFGEMWNGHVAQRGQSFDLWDKTGTPDECAYMPYFVSTNNYAFFLNYGGLVKFDIGKRKSDELVIESPVGEQDITLVLGESIQSVIRNFLTITGMPAKPPRWSFKPWFWLEDNPFAPGDSSGSPTSGNNTRPKSDLNPIKGEDFIKMVRKLHEMNIPIGVTWFEPYWQDARTSMIPDPAFSLNLKRLIKELSDLGVNTLAWTVPYTTNEASNWKEAIEKGYLVKKPGKNPDEGNVKISKSGELEGEYYNFIDYFNPEACRWWQKQIDQALALGLKGFKLDAGQDLPADAVLYGGRMGKDVHNSYALEYNRIFYETLKKKYGDDFLMIPRAAWVGSSANTNSKWHGDLTGSFTNNGLPSTIYSALSLSFSGLPFVSTDIGGYMNRYVTEDVWVRWAQFGAMLPGMQTLHMPWWFSEKAQDHYRYLSWLHTDLTPLWNTLANEAHETGAPVVRHLVWGFQDDPDTWRVDDQFMVGSSILVAPIIDTRESRDVYLPEGKWIDFWDENKVISGPKKITWSGFKETIWKFPLFIREGAIIPMEISNSYSGFGWSESKGYVTMSIWPKMKGKSQFELNDTGDKVQFDVEQTEKDIMLKWNKTNNDYLFRINFTGGAAPVKIEMGELNKEFVQEFKDIERFKASQENGWYFDLITQKIWIRIKNDNSLGCITVFKV